MIAAVGALDGMAAPKLVSERKAEEVMSQPAQVVDETIGDAVPADGEESDLATGAVDGSGHTATFAPAALACRRDVDQRDVRHGSERGEDGAAVHDQRLAAHEGAVVGREEDHRALDVVGKRVALERAGLHDGGRLEGRDGGIRLHRVAQDQPGRDRVDGDSARAELASQRARHRDHGPLRRHVVRSRAGPLTLTAMTRSHSASGISSNGWGFSVAEPAALLTSTSMRPKRATAAWTIARTDAMSLTSVRTPYARSGASSSAAATGSATSASTTRAPSARKRRPYARPMPAAPPVITATVPASRMSREHRRAVRTRQRRRRGYGVLGVDLRLSRFPNRVGEGSEHERLGRRPRRRNLF